MEINLNRTAVVFAAMGLCLWLVTIAPDDVQDQTMSGLMVLMLFEVWMRGHDDRP